MIGRIVVSDEVDETTSKIIEHGLNRYNEARVGPDPSKPIWIVCRDNKELIIGGIQGFIQWNWFYVAILWVDEDRRLSGVGTRLMAEAEDVARKNGCIRMRLATITFQAPDFYKKLGYLEVCHVPDIPPGHSLIWMTKMLDIQN
ncbi:GNAT family N-acetyltransferase [Methylobacterium sp. SD21]|uniref:GNAT family N-acetyltransferase n=1 Tax=Methylobacterium litchii TaxID=3138810 RepID=UPI00313C3157